MVAWAATGTNKKNQINHLTPSHGLIMAIFFVK